MPTGLYSLYESCDNGQTFKPDTCGAKFMSMYHWMDYVAEKEGIHIAHKLNHGEEKRVGPYLLDGYCAETNTAFEFHGCYWHGHSCKLTKSVKADKKILLEKRLEKTKLRTAFLEKRGLKVVEMRECEYESGPLSIEVELSGVASRYLPPF